ncbi:hypothetical protein JCGZ_25852 [Jatropha curcas]|uniref:Uncharacterized protein n=1 Tax=Jatropha curcas TaxID=180498 RepID=A0A067JW38_JATCU|nr:hypothetical protein JCGZ_25852 [Jatropha curcas]
MSYLNRVCVAASVAVVQGHPDQGWKASLKTLQHGKRRLFSGGDKSDLRPLSGFLGSDGGVGVPVSPNGDERGRQNDESFRQVMYLNCWGQG